MFFFNNFVTAHFVVCLAELLTFSLELPVFLVVGVGVLHRLLMLERLTLHLGGWHGVCRMQTTTGGQGKSG